ncbi:hypothetical protein ETAE_0813 [Edwardsiella piscicida]|uniref:Uncharacterized protein n=1 Tax=Edwardsiella piscicida TaxID=1263550 RepID=A0AAU8P5E4_EDWPI|nr:hypothetical protein ETAE_0813 [Edwardsiella tarda EIB202]
MKNENTDSWRKTKFCFNLLLCSYPDRSCAISLFMCSDLGFS